MRQVTDQVFAVQELGRMRYAQALEVQRQTHEAVLAARSPDVLLLVEHEPVITVSQRQTATANLLADSATLQRLGIEVQATDRGGDITYHGPGQLVVYPIIHLAVHGLNLGRYMRLLEQVVIDTVATWGVEATRVEGCTGVWIAGGQISDLTSQISDPRSQMPRKLCALGVRVRKNITMHGLALNVTTDLSHFQTIVPCGLAGKGVTSLRELLGEVCPTMDVVKATLVEQFRRQLQR